MTPPSLQPAEPMVAILIAVVALLVSIGVWLDSLRNGRRQRQLAISQKRTEILVALLDAELPLGVLIRDLKNRLTKPAPPARQKLHSRLDVMIEIYEELQEVRTVLIDGVSAKASSHKTLLWLGPILAQTLGIVKKVRVVRGDVETIISKLNEAQDSRHEP